MTTAEAEILADAGLRLRRIAESLTVDAATAPSSLRAWGLVNIMDAAALSISEVYGQLSALPLEVEA